MSKNIIDFANEYVNNHFTVTNPKAAVRLFALQAQQIGYTSGAVINLESPKVKSSSHIAFISQFAPNYSGGRYYTFQVACALKELGFDVTLYCDNQPPFLKDFVDYKWPKLVICDLTSIDIEADMYIGSPVLGSEIACSLAIKYKKPVYSLIFDSLPIMQKVKARNTVDSTVKYWERLVKLWKESDCKMIACSQMTGNSTRKWLGKKKEDVFVLYPAVNSRVLEKVRSQERRNRAVFISRIVGHKNIDVVLEAVASTDWELHIVSDTGTESLQEAIEKYNLKKRVFVHAGISDYEKFKLLKSCKIMVNASTFEGAGIWLEEAQACGLVTVCYDWPTLRELDHSLNGVFYAKYNDPKDFIKQFKKAVKYIGWVEYRTFYFDRYMTPKVRDIFTGSIKIGVVMICLNEEKFIGASLKALLKSPYISKIAVVEGADRKFSHAATKYGLSIDGTYQKVRKVIKENDANHKIILEQYGWTDSKSKLRNKGIKMLGKGINWLLVVDADEVWKEEDLNKLADAMALYPKVTNILFKHLHFWKKKTQIAIGSMWDTKLPRCFRFDDKNLRFQEHNLPPVDKKGIRINKKGDTLVLNSVFVYHYGAMKDEKDILAKLEYYQKRDTNLDVKNTWSKWKKGKATQWTHGGGTVKKFTGTHPPEVEELNL